MTFYDEMADVATELLTEFNQGVIKLVRKGAAGTPPNAYTPGTPATPTEIVLKGVARAAGGDAATQKYVDGATILASDLVVTCEASLATPNMLTDSILLDGQAKAIKMIVRIPAAGTPIVYKIIIAS